jgi:antagonist of KipI
MSLKIVKRGFFTTLQDKGRWGFQSLGVPVSGVMDEDAMIRSNLLVGNHDNSPVIEFTLHGAEVQLNDDALIALCGGGAHIFYDGKELPFNRPILLRKGSSLRFVLSLEGCRSYLAVAGGFQVPPMMNSISTYTSSKMGGVDGNILKAGDEILFKNQFTSLSKKIMESLTRNESNVSIARWSVGKEIFPKKIRFMKGPEWDWFPTSSHKLLTQSEFSILPSSNRIGYKLKGDLIQRGSDRELISTAVAKGTVQCTPDGSLIVLMSDCQTTGGYPRVASIVAADLPVVAQKKIGDTMQFMEVSFDEAEQLLLEKHRALREMKSAISTRFGL